MNDSAWELTEVLDLVAEMKNSEVPASRLGGGDRRDGRVYAYTPQIVLALQVALITSRPLLLSGPPGCGKSSLASYVARNLGFSYYEFVVTDESNPQDLLWHMDIIRRLNDAQSSALRTDDSGRTILLDYIEPGPLWWSLNPDSARHRNTGTPNGDSTPPELTPPRHLPDYEPDRPGAVLLIDEIDKADSSFCNGLLVPLGSRQFQVPELSEPVLAAEGQPAYCPLVIITDNNEKDLPDAFVRRCIALNIPRPDAQHLLRAATMHCPGLAERPEMVEKITEIAKRFETESDSAVVASTAEFLDLVGTLLALDIELDSDEWRLVERLVVKKPSARGISAAQRRSF